MDFETWFYVGDFETLEPAFVAGSLMEKPRASWLVQQYQKDNFSLDNSDPDHPFPFCISVCLNYEELLNFLVTGDPIEPLRIPRGNHYQLWPAENYFEGDLPQKIYCSEDIYESIALITLGFRWLPSKTEYGTGPLWTKLYFEEAPEMRKWLLMIQQNEQVLDRESMRYLYAYMAAKNRVTVRRKTDETKKNWLITADRSQVKTYSGAANRIAVTPDGVKIDGDDLHKFFTKKDRRIK